LCLRTRLGVFSAGCRVSDRKARNMVVVEEEPQTDV